jgi:raffinose/stachyose/melibiose transport system substrate-binding protein
MSNRSFTRRRLLGTTGAAVGAAGIATIGGRTQAAPGRFNVPALLRAADTVELTLWEQFPELKEPFEAMLDDFNKAHPEVKVNVEMTPNDQYKAKLQTALNTGSGPDLYGVESRPGMDAYITSGNLLELTGKVDLSQVTSTGVDAVTVNGKVWASPSGRYTVGLCYHTDLFDKAGITAEPSTWDEMLNVMDTLKSKNIVPYAQASKDGSLTYFNYIGIGSALLGQEGFDAVVAGTKKLNDADGVAIIDEMRKWAPYYQKNFLGTPYAEAKALFATKQTAMMDCGSADLAGYYEIDKNAKLGFFPWPAPAGKKPVTNTGMSVLYGINPKIDQAKQDAALVFANWVATPDGAKSMNAHISLLPVVTGVAPQGDPILTEMVNSPLDIPVWYERWPTLTLGDVWTKDGNSAFDTGQTSQAFADKLQAAVDSQLATPEKTS